MATKKTTTTKKAEPKAATKKTTTTKKATPKPEVVDSTAVEITETPVEEKVEEAKNTPIEEAINPPEDTPRDFRASVERKLLIHHLEVTTEDGVDKFAEYASNAYNELIGAGLEEYDSYSIVSDTLDTAIKKISKVVEREERNARRQDRRNQLEERRNERKKTRAERKQMLYTQIPEQV